MLRRTSIILLIFCIGLLCASPLRASELHNKTRQLNKLKLLINKAQMHLRHSEFKRDNFGTQLQTTDIKINNYQHELKKLEKIKQLTEQHLNIVQKQSKTLEERMHKQQELLAGQVRSAYLMGNQDYIKIILNQENPNKTQRLLTYYRFFNQARIRAINELHATLSEVTKTKMVIATENKKLHRIQHERISKLSQLQSARERNKKLIAVLDKEIISDSQKIHELKGNQHNLEDLLKGLQKKEQQAQLLEHSFAKMQHKLDWPTNGVLTTPDFAKTLQKIGIFIQAPQGQAIHAIHPGKVIFANWLRGFGLLIILEHDNGYMSLYAHNDSLYHKTNDFVNKGEVIASVGNSGGNKQTGLYFEIRHRGKALDPHHWCRSKRMVSSVA